MLAAREVEVPVEITKTKQTTVVKEVSAMVCNCCGKRATTDNPEGYCNWDQGFHLWRLAGAFGDKFPGDMEQFEIVVCEDCLRKWVESFKYPEVWVNYDEEEDEDADA